MEKGCKTALKRALANTTPYGVQNAPTPGVLRPGVPELAGYRCNIPDKEKLGKYPHTALLLFAKYLRIDVRGF